MNRTIIALSACLLFSCAFKNIESTSFTQNESSSFDALNQPSSSSSLQEQDQALRQIWERLSKNNGRIYLEKKVLSAFLGEAVYFSESVGLISLENQGIFDFKKGEEIEIQDFVAPGKLKDYCGLSLLAKHGVNSFHKEKDYYRPHNLHCAFVSEWLGIVKEERSPDQLEDFRLVIQAPAIEILCRYKSSDTINLYQDKLYRIDDVGEVQCPITEKLLLDAPALSPRTSFDTEILDYFKKELADETLIPFPKNAPVQFSDKMQFGGVRISSFGPPIWRDYQLDLSKKGFALNGNNKMIRKVRLKDSVKRIAMRCIQNEESETIFIGIGMEPIECSSFAYLNGYLSSMIFPALPPCINLKKVIITEKSGHLIKAEATFSTPEGGNEYWECEYLPLLKKAGFEPEQYQNESNEYRSYLSTGGSVKIALGGSTKPYETVYQVLFEEYPQL